MSEQQKYNNLGCVAEAEQGSCSLGQRAFKKLVQKKFVVLCFGITMLYLMIALLGYAGLLPDFQERVGGSYEAPSLEFTSFWVPISGRSTFFKVLIGTKTARLSVSALQRYRFH